MAEHDAVIVGSGINSLACAALLARAGWDVCILEREAELGGAIKTAELTEPGYVHDVFSAWHPLWVGGAAHAELGDDLAARGLEYLNTDHPTATLFPDGEAAFLLRSTDENVAEQYFKATRAVEANTAASGSTPGNTRRRHRSHRRRPGQALRPTGRGHRRHRLTFHVNKSPPQPRGHEPRARRPTPASGGSYQHSPVTAL